jgi:hypothetical protein
MPNTPPPVPTRLYRIVHRSCLRTLLSRGALHAPNTTPDDGLQYRAIHSVSVQANRHIKQIPCGPGGTAHDYVPFYFGPLSVMLLNLKTGRVQGYDEGQQPLVYLVSSIEAVVHAGLRFVFSDGHGLAGFTQWYDHLRMLKAVDWDLVGERYWRDEPRDNDRQRRKQAEFLVWDHLDWALITEIAVYNDSVRNQVIELLRKFPEQSQPPVVVRRDWYYY